MRLGRALATGVAEEQVRVDEEDLRQAVETAEAAEPEASTREEVPAAR
ncbi:MULTISPECIES: hypothetical protein [unclassified Streptomyces]|nr:hypothetical protein OG199_31220 [Streptomyces sp. NBC_01176]